MTGRISGLLPLVQKYYIGNVKEMIELSGERMEDMYRKDRICIGYVG